MSFGFGLGFPRARSASLEAAIAALFPDVWYDPSDFTTLFQDSAGTTPVTALEQPVGLMLDKSRGLVLGQEYITNAADREFSADTGFWSREGGATISGGVVNINNPSGTAAIYKFNFPNASGGYVEISFDLVLSAGAVHVLYGPGVSQTFTTSGRVSVRMYRSAVGTFGIRATGGGTAVGTIDNISVRELPGYHAYHTPGDTTTRPTVSRRINLLTKTEQFDDAAWVKVSSGTAVVPNATTAPNGTLAADKFVGTATSPTKEMYSPAATIASGVSYTASIYAKAAEYSWIYVSNNVRASLDGWFVNLATGQVGNSVNPTPGTISVTNAGDGWWLISVSRTSSTTNGYLEIFPATANGTAIPSYTGDGTSGIYIWGASLVPADLAALGYQRVNTATDYDSSEPFKQAVSLDGANDAMQTSSGGGGTTAFFFCAAIQAKQTGATQTLWSDTGTNTGYRVRINSSNQLELSAGNGSAYTTVNTTATLAVGQRAVVTAWHDGVNLNVQINSGTVAQAAFATATAGTAGFSLGKDNGAASSFFRGWIYESLYKKDVAMSASQIATAQRYCAAKAGITL